MPEPVALVHHTLEPEEAARAGVGLVTELHRRPLLLRERGGAAVGEQVDVDVFGAEEERVVAGAGDCFTATLFARERDRLDDLDPPRRNVHRTAIVRTPRPASIVAYTDRLSVPAPMIRLQTGLRLAP
jgi:hypothetical protein